MTFIDTKWFRKATSSSVKQYGYGKEKIIWDSFANNQDLHIRLDEVIECSGYIIHFRHYLLTTGCYQYRLYTDDRIQEFEDQFPFFPYNKSKSGMIALNRIGVLEKKNAELEKQNLILLSHVEAILTCLRMRGITDDNMDFTLS